MNEPHTIPGRYVVIAMFMFGILAATTMYVYWDLHTRPFRPLTEAIGKEFLHSLPKVEGGRHKGGPMTLRMTFRVPFLPSGESAETQLVLNRAIELAREKTEFTTFEVVEINLFQLAPEKQAVIESFKFEADKIRVEPPFPQARATETATPTETLSGSTEP